MNEKEPSYRDFTFINSQRYALLNKETLVVSNNIFCDNYPNT